MAALSADYRRGVTHGATWALDGLLELIEGRIATLDEPSDETGPTWDAVLVCVRDARARVTEGAWMPDQP